MTLMSDAVSLINDVTLGLEMQAQGTKKITLKSFVDDGKEGAPTYSSAKRYNAVVEAKIRLVRDATGQEVTSNTTITFVGPTPVVKAKDHILWPGETSFHEVIAVNSPIDASGVLIRECYVG